MQWVVEVYSINKNARDLLKGGEDVVYNRTHPPGFLVSARDFVIARRWTPKDGGFDWVMTSIVHKVCQIVKLKLYRIVQKKKV